MENDKRNHSEPRRRDQRSDSRIDSDVKQAIEKAMASLLDDLQPSIITGFNAFQRKQVYRHFDTLPEFGVKSYRQDEDSIMKIYPVGGLKRLAEKIAQQVIMQGEPEKLPPMGSYARFIIHSYLQDRGGVKTESEGEGTERHVVIYPIFGRTLKKAKRRLT
ncbi:hypothetical protein HQ585_06880 [candidate division KSB1 bacterium]|nr:hypothetical protein [candidate division KSB1 bacterium]